jgi:uncharacterized coiled-coil DUF342 family protein
MPVQEKKPIDIATENITEIKLNVKTLKSDVSGLKDDIKELKELIMKYVEDKQELSKKGWFY